VNNELGSISKEAVVAKFKVIISPIGRRHSVKPRNIVVETADQEFIHEEIKGRFNREDTLHR
jgi:hypothetical protein